MINIINICYECTGCFLCGDKYNTNIRIEQKIEQNNRGIKWEQ